MPWTVRKHIYTPTTSTPRNVYVLGKQSKRARFTYNSKRRKSKNDDNINIYLKKKQYETKTLTTSRPNRLWNSIFKFEFELQSERERDSGVVRTTIYKYIVFTFVMLIILFWCVIVWYAQNQYLIRERFFFLFVFLELCVCNNRKPKWGY